MLQDVMRTPRYDVLINIPLCLNCHKFPRDRTLNSTEVKWYVVCCCASFGMFLYGSKEERTLAMNPNSLFCTVRRSATLQYLVMCLTVGLISTLDFVDITTDAFVDGHYLGVIAAFGDFNSDKLTDVFCIRKEEKTVDVLLAYAEKPYLRPADLSCTMNGVISAVMPADFNGDSMMDVMIFQKGKGEERDAKILWGSHDQLKCSDVTVFKTHGLPFLVDYDGDMIPDLLGENEDGIRTLWKSSTNKSFSSITVVSNAPLQHLRIPHSSAVLDVNGDMVSDIIITGQTNIEVWLNNGKNFSMSYVIDYPKDVSVGQSTFVDFNCDGGLDHVLPVCGDEHCTSCAVKFWSNQTSEWISLLDQFEFENASWCFKPNEGSDFEKIISPVTLRGGDYDMDGYPDFIAVLQSVKSKDTKSVILQNIPSADNVLGRSLKIHWVVPGLDKISDVHLATFYDIFEDGKMDILLTNTVKGVWEVHALQNVHTYDACFFKVLVLSGRCYTDCPKNKIPYGTNQPGPMVIYNTTKPDGEPIAGCAVQMSQSAYFSLQLPYSVFGLGQTPNFVDHLTVAVTSPSNRTHKREWSQIIPNSQMVVIPHPPENEHKWVNKLFVTPSHLVLLTFVALVGTCGFIAVIVGILHWKERRDDKIEKMQDAYRFHFDAM